MFPSHYNLSVTLIFYYIIFIIIYFFTLFKPLAVGKCKTAVYDIIYANIRRFRLFNNIRRSITNYLLTTFLLLTNTYVTAQKLKSNNVNINGIAVPIVSPVSAPVPGTSGSSTLTSPVTPL